MTVAELRNIALLLKQRVNAIKQAVAPMGTAVDAWVLNATDVALPEGVDVKAVLLTYEAFQKPALSLYDELRAVKRAEGDAAPLPDSAEIEWEEILNRPDLAALDHTHDGVYALTSHGHADLAASDHTHDGVYALTSHGHADLAASDHTHDGVYALNSHGHAISEITGMPEFITLQIGLFPVGVLGADFARCDGRAIDRLLSLGGWLLAHGCPFGGGDGATTVNVPAIPDPVAGVAYYIYIGGTP